MYSLKQLSFHYPAAAKHRNKAMGSKVLNSLTLDIQASDLVGIIGPNGAGKSSLLQLLSGGLVPTAGELYLAGRAMQRLNGHALAKRVATVAQMSMPPIGLTCFQVAAMGLIPHKQWFETDNDADRHQVAMALAQVGLANKQHDATARLSGGELQRLFIARALVQQADILLLDEPTNHLDVQYQHQVLRLLQDLGKTVVCCMHDLNLAARYCNKLLLLDQGELIAFGTPDEVLQPALLQQVFGLPCEVTAHPHYGWLQVTFVSAADLAAPACNGGLR